MLLHTPPFQLDLRIATSAVEGMRFLLAGRVADINDLAGTLETMEVHVSARRSRVRDELRRSGENRRRLLGELSGALPAEVAAAFSEALTLSAQLGALDERVAGLEARLGGLRAEAATLRELSDRLREATELRGAHPDEETVRYNRAARSVARLADDDREAVARDVLGGPIQGLADMAVQLEVVRRLMSSRLPGAEREFIRCVERAATVVSQLDLVTFHIHPALLDEEGLPATLGELCRRVPPPAAGRFELIGDDTRRLPAPLEVAIFRIAQEAVRNALAHGRARQIDVILSLHQDRAIVMVRDDGEGFDAMATEARLGRTGALGLITMRQRAQLEGGSFKLRSAAGAGTEVRATFPVASPDGSPARGGA